MNSMTGFGKSEIAIDGRKMRIEMKTVNHRFLDISIRAPRFLAFLEETVRKFIKENLARGRVDVFINYSSEREDSKKVIVDMPLVHSYVKAAKEIVAETGVEDNLSISHIMRLPDAITFEEETSDEDALRTLLVENLSHAMEELKRARSKEGQQLQKDMLMRLDLLCELALKIDGRACNVVGEYKKKLDDRIKELTDNIGVDEQRLSQEVALYADRCNITEELVRVDSHIQQFKNAAKSSNPQGRNMDFIVQELNREFNTIGSKAQNTDILNDVIAAKSEVEKIREQIQNIE